MLMSRLLPAATGSCPTGKLQVAIQLGPVESGWAKLRASHALQEALLNRELPALQEGGEVPLDKCAGGRERGRGRERERGEGEKIVSTVCPIGQLGLHA